MATGRLPDPNTAPLTAKGDLYTYSTVPARLAVGSNGDTLVADSSATTGLRWQGDWNTGKNKIINGDFQIWQRGTSFSSVASNTFTADRFNTENNSSTNVTVSQQTFTPGTAPVSGYEASFFLRYAVTTASTVQGITQKIEDVRTLAGQTATFSFWAKAATTQSYTLILTQVFGSGGSAPADPINQSITIGTSWQRYSVTGTITSVSGKTIGAGSLLQVRLLNLNNTTFTLDTWGWQLEAGSVATPFTTATGTLAGELAACQRYYFRQSANATAVYSHFGTARGDGTTSAVGQTVLPVPMRVTPTSIDGAWVALTDGAAVIAATAIPTIATNQSNNQLVAYTVNLAAGGVQYRYYYVVSNNNSAGYLAFSAEL